MSIPLEIIDELSYHPNIVATKDSERNEERLIRSLQLWKDRNDFSHLLGWAAKSDFALLNGSDGLIPSTANYMPSIYAQMLAAAESFNEQKVHEMQRLSDEFGDLYQSGKTLGQSLWALKVLMQEQGLCHETVMPPLQSLGNSEAEVMRTKYAELMKRYF
jgi:4-hydroxy-tetrahydrodipicolinate synthase